ncbi:hypothetical protein PtA15_2A898 [Puccinia triticina]|uniref:Uncharacterized protein n=1 Tax=Puccinia triticina TaxID=208348 RepID=A0ABY7CBK5_9BASI|nr:uncharacterized protein PtA15_2A898 [Puccinia triticina]WAQ82581.1 hypothetical protein PtA15_2A898 [Puccinia triticina]
MYHRPNHGGARACSSIREFSSPEPGTSEHLHPSSRIHTDIDPFPCFDPRNPKQLQGSLPCSISSLEQQSFSSSPVNLTLPCQLNQNFHSFTSVHST